MIDIWQNTFDIIVNIWLYLHDFAGGIILALTIIAIIGSVIRRIVVRDT